MESPIDRCFLVFALLVVVSLSAPGCNLSEQELDNSSSPSNQETDTDVGQDTSPDPDVGPDADVNGDEDTGGDDDCESSEESPFAAGDGSESDPFELCSVQQFNAIGDDVEYMDAHFEMSADIDFGGEALTPVGSADEPFRGSFDGGGHALRQILLESPEAVPLGIFVALGEQGIIEDVVVSEVTIGGTDKVGALVGFNEGAIRGCDISATVSGDTYVGGVVGENSGELEECAVSGSLEGQYRVGGLVGSNEEDGVISDSVSDVEVKGASLVGGAVGNNEGEIEGVHAEGDVEVTGAVDVDAVEGPEYIRVAGGLAGANLGEGEISDSRAGGSVTAQGELEGTHIVEAVGGLVGLSEGLLLRTQATGNVRADGRLSLSGDDRVGVFYAGGLVGGSSSEIRKSAAGGDVEVAGRIHASSSSSHGLRFSGGLVGVALANVMDSYATGQVEIDLPEEESVASSEANLGGLLGLFAEEEGASEVPLTSRSYASGPVVGDSSIAKGGLVGFIMGEATIRKSYWDVDTSGRPESNDEAGEPRSTDEFEEPSSFQEWDFGTIWEIGESFDGSFRPVLQWQSL